MKKFLGIVVLGLLLGGCQAPYVSNSVNPKKLTVTVDTTYKPQFSQIKASADKYCESNNRGQAINISSTNHYPNNNNSTFWEYPFDCEKSTDDLKKIEMTKMIDKAKDTCKTLGFKEDTEKFSDCALKLYSQSVELAAKQNQQIVSQGLGSNVVTIYDPVRDSAAAIKRGQGLINGTCTLGDLSNC